MNLITVENLSKTIADRTLFDNLNLLINSGDRIGLLGVNGSGKTTFLRILAGDEPVTDGKVTIWGNVRVVYLSQAPDLDDSLTVLETIYQADHPQMRLLRDYTLALNELDADPNSADKQQAVANFSDRMDGENGWAADALGKTILSKLGVHNTEAKVGTLSGGQRKRVALAGALITPCDLLILDEPTNHIDADTISWLEEYLSKVPSLLMVTHDRYFLENVANRIIELDRRELVSYKGNYAAYLEQRTARDEMLKVKEAKRVSLMKRELAWIQRGAQARSTKQKARIQRFEAISEAKYDTKQDSLAIALASRRLGKRVLEVDNLSKAYGELELFEGLDFRLSQGDRIGLMGANGSGKSTLLDILVGKTEPDSGSVAWGETVHVGYYDQNAVGLKDDQKMIDYVNNIAPIIHTDDGRRIEAAQMLEWFLFSRTQQQTYIGSLSGGERRRLYLLCTLIHQPNVLILDEPTNDLDLQTLTILEQFLDNFKGCVLVVSHDRYFLDRNVDFLIPFDKGIMGTRVPTPYEAKEKGERGKGKVKGKGQRAEAKVEQPLTPDASLPTPKKLSYNEKKELEALEDEMPKLEEEKAALEAEIDAIGGDYEKLAGVMERLSAVSTNLETAETRWLELSERA